MTVDLETAVGCGEQLEETADAAGGGLQIPVDDDDVGGIALAEHIGEIGVGSGEVDAEEDDLLGVLEHLARSIPHVDVTLGDDGTQLQGRQERGDGQGTMGFAG